MHRSDRREFLAEVGQGMTAVLMGTALARELGVSGDVRGAEEKTQKSLDRLTKELRDARPEKFLDAFQGWLKEGYTLKQLVAAAALANARAFAGQDYDGYHSFMALTPAFSIASELPEKQRPLPVFKVLYRNCSFMAGRTDELGEVEAAKLGDKPADELLEASRNRKVKQADGIVTAMSKGKIEDVYEDVQPLVHDTLNVHKIVLTWRAWEILDFTGKEHARTMLRQTVRHCADYPSHSVGHEATRFREALPKLLETHRLLSKKPGTKKADDKWVEKLATTIYAESQQKAAEAVAAALAEGFSAASITEATTLAATWLVLGDGGASKASPGKPVGSVHGASVGVHASDAANAWRHVAEITGTRNTICSLLASAYHAAGQSRNQKTRLPLAVDVDKVESKDAGKLLGALEEAIRGREQGRACAVVSRYGQLGHDAKDVFALLRKYAISEDGALHAEKYYRTVSEEFARSRPAFRWQHLTALARVTASAYGKAAPGMDEARKRLEG